MQQKSITSCEICADDKAKVISSCCEDEENNYRETISLSNSKCCQEEFVYNKVEDEFVNIKTDVNFFDSSEILYQPVVLIPHTFDFSTDESFYCDSSPPFLINPELNITNSVLLI
jgi:hypothetical protein